MTPHPDQARVEGLLTRVNKRREVIAGNGGYFLIYTENFAHCFTCENFVLSRFLAFLAWVATWVELNPQHVITAEFDLPFESDPVTTARYFSKHGYYHE